MCNIVCGDTSDRGCPLRGLPPTSYVLRLDDTKFQRPHTTSGLAKLCPLNSDFHFVLEMCPALQDLRSCFFDCIPCLDSSFPLIDKFKYILVQLIVVLLIMDVIAEHDPFSISSLTSSLKHGTCIFQSFRFFSV